MNTNLITLKDYKIKDINLNAEGRSAIIFSEKDMPGLIELRKQFKNSKPLEGAKIAGCLNMTTQTAVFVETLIELGAEVRWCSSNSHSTQDEAAAALVFKGIPVFAWKEQTSEEYEWCLEQTLFEDGEWWPNLVLDDGGDLVKLIKDKFNNNFEKIKGVTEETTSGINLYRKWEKNNELNFTVINVNDAPTKNKFDNLYGCRESFIDGLKRATDRMIGGKVAIVSGYGYVGKGCAKLLRDYGARVYVTEVDPIAALQATMEGFEVRKLSDVAQMGDIFVTCTGNIEVIKMEHLEVIKDGAILCNMGHRDVEVDMQLISKFKKKTLKPLVDAYEINGKSVIVLGSGKDVNLACATGHPDFVMSISLTNQTFALMKLNDSENKDYINGIYNLPRIYDELNASYHLKSMGITLDSMNDAQYDYMGIKKGEQLKLDSYLY
jgi:adenosylhomocysteinase